MVNGSCEWLERMNATKKILIQNFDPWFRSFSWSVLTFSYAIIELLTFLFASLARKPGVDAKWGEGGERKQESREFTCGDVCIISMAIFKKKLRRILGILINN